MEHGKASSRYAQLESTRTQFLDIARECARLTVPYLLPEGGSSSGDRLPQPWQSIGAKGVNAMASKLMLALFPINTKFFKLQINDGALASDPELDKAARSEIDSVLSKMERVVLQDMSETADRIQIYQGLKHVVTTGNVLLYMAPKALKLYPLDRYVVVRDGQDQVTEFVTIESVDRRFLPKEFQKKTSTSLEPDNPLSDNGGGQHHNLRIEPHSNEVAVYTWGRLKDGMWEWHQECEEKVIPNSRSTAPKSKCPWIPVRFNVVDGEDYGRGRVEEYLGDLKSLDSLMQSLVEGAAVASKVIFLVNPSSTTKPNQLAEASNGAVIQGRQDDVSVVQVAKAQDFGTAKEMVADLTQRLSEAFLIMRVRDSERTTAEEVRAIRQEADEMLGGVYSNLTVELLKPYLNRKLMVLERDRKIPKLPKGVVFPTVVAGLEGVGRGQDFEAFTAFMRTMAETFGPDTITEYINVSEGIKRIAASLGIEQLGLVKTEEELAQEQEAAQQAQQQQALLEQAGQLAGTPVMDPTKNPQLLESLNNNGNPQQQEPGLELGGSPDAQIPPGG